MATWRLRPNIDKTEAMFIPHSPPSRVLYRPLSTTPVRIVSKHKHLGVVNDNTCWSSHIEHICKRTSSALGMVQPHCRHLSSNCKYLFYRCYILPIFDFCDTAWRSALSVSALNKLEVHHRLLLKIMHNKDRLFSFKSLYYIAHTTPLILVKSPISALLFIKYIFRKLLPTCKCIIGSFLYGVPAISTSFFLKSAFFSGYSYWQALPAELKACRSIERFNKLVPQVYNS